jgi:hypothetical protein
MKKRGQVTVFVILGLIVFLVVFISIMFLFQRPQEPDDPDILTPHQSAIIQPIERDIHYCIHDLGKEIINEIGLTGGRTTNTNLMRGVEPAYLNEALELIPGSDIIIPFWAYYEGPPDCTNCNLIMSIPELTGPSQYTIESQIKNHINNNILECMNEFQAHTTDKDIIAGTPNSNVVFTNEAVLINLDWPINIVLSADETININKFSNEIDVKLKKMYELSRTLLMQLILLDDEPHIEKTTIQMLKLVSLKGQNAEIPPLIPEESSSTGTYNFWLLSQTKNLIKQLLYENTNYIQVKGSKNAYYPATGNDLYDNIYGAFEFDPLINDYDYLKETKIRFHFYEHWPIHLKISPSRGELITPQRVPVKVPLMGDIGRTVYDFSYDLTYPVLVTLDDTTSYEGEGYSFQFAITTSIYNNAPRDMELNDSMQIEVEEEYDGGFGSHDQRTIPVNIRLINAYTGQPIEEDLPIIYSCGDVSLYVGNMREEGTSSINTIVPPCVDGTFYVERYDLQSEAETMNLEVGESYGIDINVYFEQEVPISLGTLRFAPTGTPPINLDDSRGWITALSEGQGISPLDEEEILVMLTRIKENPQDTDFFRVLNFNENIKQEVGLVPGKYELILVSTVNLNENNIIIEERNYTIDGDPNIVTMDEIVFNESIFIGNLDLKGDSALIVTPDVFLREIHLIYPSYDYKELKYHQDLEVLEIVNNATNEYPDSFGYFIR